LPVKSLFVKKTWGLKISQSTFAFPAMACAILIIVGAGSAHAQPPKCGNTIYSCGCIIGAPGTYELANDLNASQGLTIKNGCIDIEGSKVTLLVNYMIIGPGQDYCMNEQPPAPVRDSTATTSTNSPKPAQLFGVGIHVLPSASSVSVQGYATCGWNYGYKSEGSSVTLS
jgi:hypothetical protein